MCCTQQGRLSSLLLLQLELQILKRCRTCTLQITIHHLGSASPGKGASPHGADPFWLRLQPQLELRPWRLFGVPHPCPSQSSSWIICWGLGLKFSEMITKPPLFSANQIFRLLSAIRLLPRWPIIIKLWKYKLLGGNEYQVSLGKGLLSCEVIIKLKCDISLVSLESLPTRSVAQQKRQNLHWGGTEKSSVPQKCQSGTSAGKFPKIGLRVIKSKEKEKYRVWIFQLLFKTQESSC